MAHRQDHLHHPGDARGALGVADVGLHRAQHQRAFAILAVGREEGLRLDRVAEAGPRSVRLDDVHVGGFQAGVGQGVADDTLLGRPVGSGQAVGGAVLVDSAAADHGQHLVAVAAGVRKAFQQEHTDALAPGGAVRGPGERLAPPVRCQALLLAEQDEHAGVGHHGDATGQCHGALALTQRPSRPVQGDQRGGAGRVHGDGRPFQAEGVGDPAGGDARGRARAQVQVNALGDLRVGAVQLRGGADEHAGATALEGTGVEPGVLDRLPGGLQQEPLLRVHRQRLVGADAEEPGVEPSGLAEESPVAGVAGAGAAGVRVVDRAEVPAPVGGELRDRVHLVGHEPPQVLGGPHAAGEAAGHADDGDGLVPFVVQLLDAAVRLAGIGHGPLEIVAQLIFVGHGTSLPACEVVAGGRRCGPDGVRVAGRTGTGGPWAAGYSMESTRANSSSSVAASRSLVFPASGAAAPSCPAIRSSRARRRGATSPTWCPSAS